MIFFLVEMKYIKEIKFNLKKIKGCVGRYFSDRFGQKYFGWDKKGVVPHPCRNPPGAEDGESGRERGLETSPFPFEPSSSPPHQAYF